MSDIARGKMKYSYKKKDLQDFIFASKGKDYNMELNHAQIALKWISSREGIPLVCKIFGRKVRYPEITGVVTYGNIPESIWRHLCEDYLVEGVYKYGGVAYRAHFVLSCISYSRLAPQDVGSAFEQFSIKSKLAEFFRILINPRVYGLDYLTFLNLMENERCTHYQMMIGLFYLEKYNLRSFTMHASGWQDYARAVIADKLMYERMLLFISKGYFSKDLVISFCKQMAANSKWNDLAYLLYEGLEEIPFIEEFPESKFVYEVRNENHLNCLVYLFESYIWLAFDYQRELSKIVEGLEARGFDIASLAFVIGDIGMSIKKTE
jgi:hypothetical protein